MDCTNNLKGTKEMKFRPDLSDEDNEALLEEMQLQYTGSQALLRTEILAHSFTSLLMAIGNYITTINPSCAEEIRSPMLRSIVYVINDRFRQYGDNSYASGRYSVSFQKREDKQEDDLEVIIKYKDSDNYEFHVKELENNRLFSISLNDEVITVNFMFGGDSILYIGFNKNNPTDVKTFVFEKKYKREIIYFLSPLIPFYPILCTLL